jgi:hypothetical protein
MMKASGTRWTVRVVSVDANDLASTPLPAVVSIADPGLPLGILGVGNRHSVVVMGMSGLGHVRIADPFTGGIQIWSVPEYSAWLAGPGLALVHK